MARCEGKAEPPITPVSSLSFSSFSPPPKLNSGDVECQRDGHTSTVIASADHKLKPELEELSKDTREKEYIELLTELIYFIGLGQKEILS